MKQFRITFIQKEVAKDHYETGCELTRRLITHEKLRLTADSFPELVRKAKAWVGYQHPEDNYVFMPDLSDGWFSFNQLEDDDGNPVDGKNPDFISGKIHYWLADYMFSFEVVEFVELTEADLEGLVVG